MMAGNYHNPQSSFWISRTCGSTEHICR